MSETDLTPSALIRSAADGAYNDSAIDGTENAVLLNVAQLLDGLSVDGIKKLLRIKELAERIVTVNLKTSTEKDLKPLFVMDYEAAKELLDIF